jgi:hypothetical protein
MRLVPPPSPNQPFHGQQPGDHPYGGLPPVDGQLQGPLSSSDNIQVGR